MKKIALKIKQLDFSVTLYDHRSYDQNTQNKKFTNSRTRLEPNMLMDNKIKSSDLIKKCC